MPRWMMSSDLRQDLRISLRGLLRAPVMTLTIVTTVGLGIGATTTIFGALHAALLRPLPYADPGRLVRIYTDAPPNRFPFSVADYLALQAQHTHFEQIAGIRQPVHGFQRRHGRRAPVGKRGVADVLLAARNPSGARPRFRRAGRPAGQPARGHGQPRILAAPARRAAGRDRKTIRLDGRTTRSSGVLPSVGPLERGRDFFVAAQWDTPRAKRPFSVRRAGTSTRPRSGRPPPRSCARSTAASSRCGRAPTRTTGRPGA